MELGLDDRVAIVTAASKGLGRASAVALAAEGARVVLNARSTDLLGQVAEDIVAAGGQEPLVVPGDVTDPEVPAALVDAAVAKWGRLDIAVANAGGPPSGRAFDVDDEQLLAAFNANMLASVRLARAALPHLRAGGWGRICCIASGSVRQPIPDLALSNTARTALWAWVKTASKDVAADGITINIAAPGLHATDRMLQLGLRDGRAGEPADFGKVVAFLCSEPAAFVNGIAMGVDGGVVSGLL